MISVIGLGKLGLPLSAVLAERFPVIGVDTSRSVVMSVNKRKPRIVEPALDELLQQLPSGRLTATTSIGKAVRGSEITFIIVPTPSTEKGDYDNTYVLNVLEQIGDTLRTKQEYHNIVLCSTVMPGSMDEFRAMLEHRIGRPVGSWGFCYSPEFIALGSVIKDLRYPDTVFIGAYDRKSSDHLKGTIRSYVRNSPPFHVMSPLEAEIAKISVNCYLTLKISYANMLAEVAEALPGVSAHRIVKALGDDVRIGRRYLSPGGPAGGPCLDRDQRAFTVFAQNIGVRVPLMTAVDEVNLYQSVRIAKMVDSLHQNSAMKIGIAGMAFKEQTDVTEQSLGLVLARKLRDMTESTILYYDPLVDKIDLTRIKRAQSIDRLFNECDIVVITLPYEEIYQAMPDVFYDRPWLNMIDINNRAPDLGPWEIRLLRIGIG